MEKYKIERLDHQGRGITYVNNKITFVENALPNEEVTINIVNENKKIVEAKVKKYIKKSEDRIDSKCLYYDECGGCDIMHMSYEKQLLYKTNKIKDIITRYTKISSDVVNNIVPSPQNFNYRNKITLKVNKNIGYYRKKSNNIIPIDSCLLANESINNAIKYIGSLNINPSISELILRSIDEVSLSLTICLQTDSKIADFIDKIDKYFDEINILTKNKLNIVKGKGNIIGRLSNYKFQMSPTAFFQVNTLQTINLYDKVKSYVKNEMSPSILDLYCGTGTIGIYVSEYAKNVIGVEINKFAIENAKINAENNNIKNITFFAGDTKTILGQKNFQADLVIVDPPRSGLDKEVIVDILKIKPKTIIYVSCDPMTLARDINILNEEYNIKEITPFDMFPNTSHVESVALLLKK